MNIPRVLFLCLAMIVSAHGSSYYVSPTLGDDTGYSGTTATAPYRTIVKALQTAHDGDTIFLRSGAYAESVYCAKGSSSQPLIFQAYLREIPVLGKGPAGYAMYFNTQGVVLNGLHFTSGGVTFQNCGNSVVEKCVFSNITDNIPLYVDSSQNLRVTSSTFSNSKGGATFANCDDSLVQDCTFSGITGAIPLYVGASRGFQVTSSTFTNNRYTSTIVVTGACGAVDVTGNQCQNNYADPGLDQNVIVTNAASGTITISENTLSNTSAPASIPIVPAGSHADAIRIYRTNGVLVSNNVIHDYRFRGTNDDRADNPAYLKTPAQGGEIGNGISVVGATPTVSEIVTVTSNTITHCSEQGIVCAYVKNSLIADNTVTNCGLYGIFLIGVTGDATQVIDNTIQDNTCGLNGWLTGGTSGISIIQGGTHNIMRRNFCYENQQGTAGTVGVDWYADGNGLIADLNSHGTIIENNLSINNQGSGIAVNKANNCILLSNTVVGNGYCPQGVDAYGIILNGTSGDANHATVVNNLIYNNRLSQLFVAKTLLDHVIHHNLYAAGSLTHSTYLNNIIAWNGQRYTVASWQSLMAGTANGVGDLSATPTFAGDISEPGVANFTLKGTVAVGAGTALSNFTGQLGYLITWDLINALRNATHPSMGALESMAVTTSSFFNGQTALSNGVYYLAFPNGNYFGYYSYLADPRYIYHFDLGYEYSFDAADGKGGVYFYDFASGHFFYTSPIFPFPYLYDFTLNAVLYYYPDPNNAGHYNTNGVRYFYNTNTGQILTQ